MVPTAPTAPTARTARTARTASGDQILLGGSSAGLEPGELIAAPDSPATASRALILTLTRACNLRCAYCPTAKAGGPSLDIDQALSALRLFSGRFGGGDVKLFGGEPLLEPQVVRAVIDAASTDPGIRRVYLSTNGLGLDRSWLRRVAREPKLVLTISLDGRPDDHRRLRRPLDGAVPDAYDHVMSLLDPLLATPRVVITQTIAPSAASAALANFDHLRSLGFHRFNLLPGYFLPWSAVQLEQLDQGLAGIAERARGRWAQGRRLYLRNLFTWSPTPFFNQGLVVDSDGTLHSSNAALTGQLERLAPYTRVGSLDEPPTVSQLVASGRRTNEVLARELAAPIWDSTLAVDGLLSRFCESLYPHWIEARRRRSVSA